MYENGLEAFLAILRHGGFGAAAEELNLTQSTVSHRLMDLETKIGMRLLERGKDFREQELTSAGKKLLPIAEKWQELAEEIRNIAAEERVISLSIVAADTVNAYIFPPLYELLSHNDVSLKISSRRSPSIPMLIEKKLFDIGYAYIEQPTPNTVARELFRENIVLLRPYNNAEAREPYPSPIDNDALKQEDELYFCTWGPWYEIWHEQWWGKDKPHLLQIDTPSVFASLFSRPEQWSLVPFYMARHFVSSGKFVIQQLKNPPPERICFEIRHRHMRYNAQPGFELLQKFLAEVLKKD